MPYLPCRAPWKRSRGAPVQVRNSCTGAEGACPTGAGACATRYRLPSGDNFSYLPSTSDTRAQKTLVKTPYSSSVGRKGGRIMNYSGKYTYIYFTLKITYIV